MAVVREYKARGYPRYYANAWRRGYKTDSGPFFYTNNLRLAQVLAWFYGAVLGWNARVVDTRPNG